MLRLSEEQKAILSCYSGTKEEITAELRKALPFIEDVELRELSAELLEQMENIPDEEFALMSIEGILDIYDESEEAAVE